LKNSYKRFKEKIVYIIVSLIIATAIVVLHPIYSQASESCEVNGVSIDQTEIQVGESFTLTVDVSDEIEIKKITSHWYLSDGGSRTKSTTVNGETSGTFDIVIATKELEEDYTYSLVDITVYDIDGYEYIFYPNETEVDVVHELSPNEPEPEPEVIENNENQEAEESTTTNEEETNNSIEESIIDNSTTEENEIETEPIQQEQNREQEVENKLSQNEIVHGSFNEDEYIEDEELENDLPQEQEKQEENNKSEVNENENTSEENSKNLRNIEIINANPVLNHENYEEIEQKPNLITENQILNETTTQSEKVEKNVNVNTNTVSRTSSGGGGGSSGGSGGGGGGGSSSGSSKRSATVEKQTTTSVTTTSLNISSDCVVSEGNWSFNEETKKWSFISNGQQVSSTWVLNNGKKYLVGDKGEMLNGWQMVNNQWYFLNSENGEMNTGWVHLDGKYYYLADDGHMMVNEMTPDGYFVDENGNWEE